RRRHTRSKRDWSSDVCSSDLGHHFHVLSKLVYQLDRAVLLVLQIKGEKLVSSFAKVHLVASLEHHRELVLGAAIIRQCAGGTQKIGRASCRERVENAVGDGGG